eukprot:5342375-Amphidinium_carterae.1
MDSKKRLSERTPLRRNYTRMGFGPLMICVVQAAGRHSVVHSLQLSGWTIVHSLASDAQHGRGGTARVTSICWNLQ